MGSKGEVWKQKAKVELEKKRIGKGTVTWWLSAQGAMLAGEKSKEALDMIALHEALRNVCLNFDWTYAVFWTIRPRPRCRGGTNCKVAEENGSLMLMWEDGFCRLECRTQSSALPSISSSRGRGGGFQEQLLLHGERSNVENLAETDTDDPIWKAFRKMSIQLYNYGEGLMGKVASDKCHKWVFKESSDCDVGISSYWQSSFDAHPLEWMDQFTAGIQTIAVIQAGQGLLQLGSCKVIPEDLHFVLRMRHVFESLDYPSGLFLPHPFGGLRNRPATMYPAFAQPPSPHSWSLCTVPTSIDQTCSRFRPAAAASLLTGDAASDQIKAAAASAGTVATDHRKDELMQSPRLSLNTGSSMTIDSSASIRKQSQTSPRQFWPDHISATPIVMKSNQATIQQSQRHMLEAQVPSPSSSKLYQRRSVMPKVHLGLPLLTSNMNSSGTISTLEAFLVQQGSQSTTVLGENTGFLTKLSPTAYPNQDLRDQRFQEGNQNGLQMLDATSEQKIRGDQDQHFHVSLNRSAIKHSATLPMHQYEEQALYRDKQSKLEEVCSSTVSSIASNKQLEGELYSEILNT